MPFVQICELLDRLEGVAAEPGFSQRRRTILTLWWLSPAGRPRHLRRNLFDVFRLLPHDDTRRYYWGETGLAKAAGLTMGLGEGLGELSARELSHTWLDDRRWGAGEPRDLSRVLKHEWEARCAPVTARVSVGDVNYVLDRIDRAHAGHGAHKSKILSGLVSGRTSGSEIKWLVRILYRNLAIGERPSMPVPHKGEWPKCVMDSFCRAQGRTGRPSVGNPPRMYTGIRHQHSLRVVCGQAEAGTLLTAYLRPACVGVHVRAQGSCPCTDNSAAAVLSRLFPRPALADDRRVYLETKFDRFWVQVHCDRDTGRLQLFYRSGVDATADLAPDLAPALRLALLGTALEEEAMRDRDGETIPRFRHFVQAWEAAPREAHWRPPSSVVLDGEFLVYDEAATPAGRFVHRC